MDRFVADDRRTLHGALLTHAERQPDSVALTILGEHITYAELVGRSRSLANGLTATGLGRGDVVAMLTENCCEQAYVQFGAAMTGAVEVMINTAYRGEFLRHQLADSGAKAIVVDEGLLPAVVAVAPKLPELATIFVRGAVDVDDRVGSAQIRPSIELFGHDGTSLRSTYQSQWSDPCSIVYTSGTTGPSKGAVLSHNYLMETAGQMAGMWYEGPDSAFYSTTPMFHLAAKGCGVVASISMGARCVLDQRFSVSAFWKRIREERCTATIVLGSMIVMLWNQEPTDDEGIDVLYAVPFPTELKPAMERRWSCRFITGYGLSEANLVAKVDPAVPIVPGSSGRTNDEVFDVRIFDDEGCEVPPGTPGEVVVRPKRPHVMFEGYYNNPAATQRVSEGYWFHTGDMARIDEDRNFYFLDRKKDYLRRRGENISSYEVEQAIMTHPDVDEAAVIGVKSDMLEDEVKALLVLRAGTSPSHESLVEHFIENLPYFAVPRYVEIVDDLPRTPTGKVEKYKLRASSFNEQTWDREAAGIVLSGRPRS
ncbi:MAG: AMP-binding protein [Acidimicrobiia bacterium]